MTYQVKDYWEQRFKARFSLASTGHTGFSENYNRYMYERSGQVFERAMSRYVFEVQGYSC